MMLSHHASTSSLSLQIDALYHRYSQIYVLATSISPSEINLLSKQPPNPPPHPIPPPTPPNHSRRPTTHPTPQDLALRSNPRSRLRHLRLHGQIPRRHRKQLFTETPPQPQPQRAIGSNDCQPLLPQQPCPPSPHHPTKSVSPLLPSQPPHSPRNPSTSSTSSAAPAQARARNARI